MAKQKGTAKTGGRQKGTPNLLSAGVREMILEALDQAGGVEYLVERARDQPQAFMGLVGKTLPREIKAELMIGLSERMRQILAGNSGE
jgi:hypothetical protein